MLRYALSFSDPVSARNDSDGAGPAGGSAVDLDREADDLEPVGRQLIELVEFFQMRIADLAAGAMAFPDQRGVAARVDPGAGVGERRVPAPGIGADQAHALAQQPQRRLAAHAAA